ncbi:hypothetical protein F4604DRAFT_1673521 [Suillus subluteus]|nr:hypothetical protein F4604DRAFT_1673521 [Suillus subluteus]
MGGSKVQEWTPTRNISVVEWKKTFRSRKVTGKWVERPKIQKIQSVPATPTKSSSKQPSQNMLYDGGDEFLGDLHQQDFIPLQLPKSLSQNDYLRQWVPKTQQYLNILLGREVPADRSCIICGTDGVYKCHQCFGEPLLCTNCCRMEHQRLPFHRISQWTGGFFEDCCLVKTWLVIWLGHNGNPCPCQGYEVDDIEELFAATSADSKHADDNVGPEQNPKDSNNGNDAYDAELDEQPTSVRYSNNIDDLPTGVPFIKNHKTMTTIVDKSGVHTHIIKYCTCADAPSTDIQLFQMGMFPASFSQPKTAFTFDVLDDFLLDNLECGTSVMNYYSKLRRMTTGDYGETNNKSDLETPSWLHSRSLVMDGNFKAEHLHAANPIDEVSLMDGRGFMVGDSMYKAHLAKAKTLFTDLSPTHLATNWKQRASGVVPVQDMAASSLMQWWTFRREKASQTATRQMNMDYALCEGLKHNADGIQCALTFYDVNCQYHKYLKDCIADNPFLDIQPELEIIPGIGLWHVHGHQDSCYDYEGKALCRKFRQAVKGVADSKMAFEKLDQTANANQVREWEEQEKLAQQRRTIDPKAMDIYEVRMQKGVWEKSKPHLG